MLIGKLAERAGISVDTVRFYEKRGLLDENHFVRCRNGYKEYSNAAVDRLKLILCAKRLRFTLKEIISFVADLENERLSPEEREKVLKKKIDFIENQIRELKETKQYIKENYQFLSKKTNEAAANQC